MEHNVNIQEELLQVAPSLAAIGQQMPSRVPDGYFDTLALEMLRKTALPLQGLVVPEGYFEILPLELLLKAAGQQQTAEVPEGYFETLPLQLLLKANGKQQTATVPQGYFDNFADKMLVRVKALETREQNEEELSPLLKSIGKKTPFTVPAGYFEQITVSAPMPSIAPPAVDETAPVVQMRPKRNYMAWAVAACSIGIISLVTWQYVGKDNPTIKGPVVVKNTTNLIATDSSAATVELAAALAKLEDNTLQNAISQTGASEADTHSAVFYLNTDNFENAVKDLSDEELEQYLSESIGVSKKS